MITKEQFLDLSSAINRSDAKLIAVSKTKPISAIETMYSYGQRLFGENRVPELVEKQAVLPDDIEWHMIGSLQRNKVKYIAPFIHLIHSVDSLRLLVEINKQADKNDRIIHCLLQFHIAEEETKSGLDWQGVSELLTSEAYASMQNIRIVGVMGMATFTSDKKQITNEFKQLVSFYNRLKDSFLKDNPYFKEISMGMSGDYSIAIEQGSTMVRIGSKLFGHR